MPPKRRRAPSSPELTPVAHSSRRRSSTSYDSLPTELKIHIVELACISSSPSGPLYDLATCLSLSLVNKQCHAQVLPHLYRQVSITRPSSLYSLDQTLQSHPERGPLIKNLHIGSQTLLPADWWPITVAYPEPGSLFARQSAGEGRSYTWLATSLPPEELPDDFEKACSLDAAKSGCRAAAIDDALQVAQDTLGVDLLRKGITTEGEERVNIGAVLEVQAVLDLYLAKIKAIEDADPKLARLAYPGARVPAPCRNGKCDHYPMLAITETAPPTLSSSRSLRSRPAHIPPGAFVLPRSQLLRHISRRGAVADRFDHPLLIERSGFDVTILPPRVQEPEGYSEKKAARYEVIDDDWGCEGKYEFEDWADLDALPRADEQDLKRAQEGREALNAPLISTATFGSCLRLARSSLAHCTALQNLSLTGFLERAVGSGQELPSLRCLTIGPPPLSWLLKIAFEGLGHRLEEMRVGGIMLIASEIDAITTNFRKLKKLDWSLGHRCDESGEGYLVGTINRLVNWTAPSPTEGRVSSPGQEEPTIDIATPSAAGELSLLKGKGEDQDRPSYIKAEAGNSEPLIIVHLDKTDLASVLATAPSPQVQEAWLKGLSVPGVPRRLLLLQKELEHEAGEASLRDSTSAFWQRMYGEGTEWWLRRAV